MTQVVVDITDSGTQTWTNPGVTTAIFEYWAAGGPGQDGTALEAGVGGGGGGYARGTITGLVTGDYSFNVGDPNGDPGTYLTSGTSTPGTGDLQFAEGGSAGDGGGLGGTNNVGQVVFSGGTGALPTGLALAGGGGGAGGQYAADGNSATDNTGAIGDGSGNGDGGRGGFDATTNKAGAAGAQPGGGGGGGYKAVGATGGAAAAGKVRITYTAPLPPILYLFDPADLDGDQTNNSAYDDAAVSMTMKNYTGLAGGNATPATNYSPTLYKSGWNGRGMLDFHSTMSDAWSAYMTLTGSASVFKPHTNGLFDIIMVVRPYLTGRNMGLICNTNDTGEKGIRFIMNSSGAVRCNLYSGAALLATAVTTDVAANNVLTIITARCDGVNLKVSVNGSAEVSAALSGAFGTGNATRDYFLASESDGGSQISGFNGKIGKVQICNGVYSTTPRNAYLASLATYYGL